MSISSTLLVIGLDMSVFAVRGSAVKRSVVFVAYRVLLVVVAVSIPIGIALSWTRH